MVARTATPLKTGIAMLKPASRAPIIQLPDWKSERTVERMPFELVSMTKPPISMCWPRTAAVSTGQEIPMTKNSSEAARRS